MAITGPERTVAVGVAMAALGLTHDEAERLCDLDLTDPKYEDQEVAYRDAGIPLWKIDNPFGGGLPN